MDEAELLRRLREAFSTEAQERLASLSSRLISLEKGSSQEAKAHDLEVAFREAHSLKGAARSVNLSEIETLCQAVEGVFAAMKRDEIRPSAYLYDMLHQCVRSVEAFLATPEADRSDGMGTITSLVSRLKAVQSKKAAQPSAEEVSEGTGIAEERGRVLTKVPGQTGNGGVTEKASLGPDPGPAGPKLSDRARRSPVPHHPTGMESVRVSRTKLDALFLKAEEMVSLKLSSDQHVADLKRIGRSIDVWGQKWAGMEDSIRLFQRVARKGDVPHAIDQFLQWNHDVMRSMGAALRSATKGAEQKGRTLGLMVDDLLDDMKRVTMLPFSILLEIFPRMVREISRDQGKEADLVVRGGEVEIDRRILEGIRDPLTHILRNAVDHGLEPPGDREREGKPRCGTIELSISQTESGKVEILIADDGPGIDLEEVKAKAVGLGIITQKELETLDDRDALALVLRSGVSTSPIVTDLSGRGLGLAIVQENVEKLGGLLTLHTSPGSGTSFRMELPVTIATFRGVQVRVSGRSFVIPSLGMERTLRVKRGQIRTVENRAALSLDGKALSLMDFADIFGLGRGQDVSSDPDVVTVVVLGIGEKRIGFRVDEVMGEQEVLVKGLGKQLRHVPFISGATILGSGAVVPILNVKELLDASRNSPTQGVVAEETKGEAVRRSILVAEDSITSRMLLKSILESAGYEVQTAVDGAEALATLKTGAFDLVVSDVEMPRMDGFELTRRIRADPQHKDIPVILVTGLGTQEDRERGIDAGASAYIVKSSFDQSNLLDVIRRMI